MRGVLFLQLLHLKERKLGLKNDSFHQNIPAVWSTLVNYVRYQLNYVWTMCDESTINMLTADTCRAVTVGFM